MKKLFIITSVALSAICLPTAGHAKNNLQTISYDIDAATCAVTVSSIDAQDLKKIVFRDSSGKKQMTLKGKDIEGSTYTFDVYMSALLADGSLQVQSHKNGRGEEIGGDLKADLEACLSTPVCPFEAEIDAIKDAADVNLPFDEPLSCTLYDTNGSSIGVSNNYDETYNADETPYVGVIYYDVINDCVQIGNLNFEGPDPCGTQDGNLDSEELRACAVYLSEENCGIFISELDGSTQQLQ